MQVAFKYPEDAYKDYITRQLPGTEVPDRLWVMPIINDVVDSLLRANILQHKVALIEINNRTGMLPVGFDSVIQAAYDFKLKPNFVAVMTKHIKDHIYSKCKIETTIICEGCHHPAYKCECHKPEYILETNHYDQPEQLYQDNPQHMYSYVQDYWNPINHQGRCSYHPEFKLMRLKEGSFWNLSGHIPNCANLSVDTKIAYDIQKPIISVNFDHGWVLLAYRGKPTYNGLLMVPDEPKVYTAIRHAIDYEWDYVRSRRTFNNETAGRLQLSKQLKDEAWQIAYNQLAKLSSDELYQMVRELRKMYPQDDSDNLYRGYEDLNDTTYNLQF